MSYKLSGEARLKVRLVREYHHWKESVNYREMDFLMESQTPLPDDQAGAAARTTTPSRTTSNPRILYLQCQLQCIKKQCLYFKVYSGVQFDNWRIVYSCSGPIVDRILLAVSWNRLLDSDRYSADCWKSNTNEQAKNDEKTARYRKSCNLWRMEHPAHFLLRRMDFHRFVFF